MTLCHGSGDPVQPGCCFVAGKPCPLRWKIVGDHIYDHQGTDLGTVDAYLTSIIPNKPGRDRAKAQIQGVTIACRAAVETLVADPKRLTDRPAFNAAWNSHPEYVSLVRPHWEKVEEDLGLPAGSYQCSTWRGTGRPQCCFAETSETNTAKASGLSAQGRQVRAAGGG